MIAIGGAIGTGIFLASGATINQAGPGGALVAYASIGIMVYFLMTSLGEMATFMPVSGSFQIYASNEETSKVFSTKTMFRVINYLYLVENGINTMSMDIKGLVESSVSLGVVTSKKSEVEFTALIRSSVKSLYIELLNRIEVLAKLIGGEVIIQSNCPLWEYKADSKVRGVFEEVYNKMYGKKPEITAVHVGLECGVFDEIFNGDMDMISFGSDTYDFHTPHEHMSISSIKRSWEFLLEVLKAIV